MNITITTDSGKRFNVEPQILFKVDATDLDDCSWQYSKEHSQLQRVDGVPEVALYIGDDTDYLDNLVRNIIEYGCSQDFVELIELSWNHHVTWLMLHR